jgi:hypothetical protein
MKSKKLSITAMVITTAISLTVLFLGKPVIIGYFGCIAIMLSGTAVALKLS